jgi:hypothetical protein
VALAILTVAYVIMLIANISPPPNSGMQCLWQFPKVEVSEAKRIANSSPALLESI